ncbi:MAG: biliverdin-producing heme oxygenase [Cellulomonas sp.]
MDFSGAEPAARLDSVQRRLREGTADLHAMVERAVDLPRAVRSRRDYRDLLSRFHQFHRAVESSWARPDWVRAWVDGGIDLEQHRRAHLLAADLVALGEAPPTAARVVRMPEFASWAQGLGSLYVIEGSAIGGRVLGPAIRTSLGPVPTAFFDSAGRAHPSPWRAVTGALTRFSDAGGDVDEVLQGAREAFVAYGAHLGHAGSATPA